MKFNFLKISACAAVAALSMMFSQNLQASEIEVSDIDYMTLEEYNSNTYELLAQEELTNYVVFTQKSSFSLRTNLLYWVGGMANLGFEWQPEGRVSLLLNAGYSPFGSGTDWNRYMGGWFVAPEVRCYLGQTQNWFIGAQFVAGDYDYKPSVYSYDGFGMAGVLVGGYKMRLSDTFDMDFSLGCGYGTFEYDTYRRIDGEDVLVSTGTKENRFVSPIHAIHAGISLIWKL